MTLSSNFDTFIQTQFHPMNIYPKTVSSQKFTCGTINIVRVFVKASPAEGRRRFHTNTAYARLLGFNRPSCGGLLKVERREFRCLGFRVQALGFMFRMKMVLDESVIG